MLLVLLQYGDVNLKKFGYNTELRRYLTKTDGNLFLWGRQFLCLE